MKIKYVLNNYQYGAKLKSAPKDKIVDIQDKDRYHKIVVFDLNEREREFCNKLFAKKGEVIYRIDAIKAAYAEGTRIYIDYISDNSYPKAVGHYGTVLSVDDIGQVHCRMDNGTTATVCKEYGDSFYKV